MTFPDGQLSTKPGGPIRIFDTGATRNGVADKFDYEGFLSPLVIEAFGRYMHENRLLPNGDLRDSDNWQLGIPLVVYAKSMWRHFVAFWKVHRGYPDADPIEKSLCAIIFNAQGYLHEHLKARSVAPGATNVAKESPDTTLSPAAAALADLQDEDAATEGLNFDKARDPEHDPDGYRQATAALPQTGD